MKRAFSLIQWLFLAVLLAACSSAPSPAAPATLPPAPSHPAALTPTSSATVMPPTPTAAPPTPSALPLPTMAVAGLKPLVSDQAPSLTFIQMIEGGGGWAGEIGGHLLHLGPGGGTWHDVTPSAGTYPGQAGFFAFGLDTAWATPTIQDCSSQPPCPAAAQVWRTADGGRSWQASQPFAIDRDRDGAAVPVAYYHPIQLQFVNPQDGWLLVEVAQGTAASARALLFHTQDGGFNWSLVNDAYHDLQSCVTTGLAFTSPTTGWIGGNCLEAMSAQSSVNGILAAGGWRLAKTTDAGLSWKDASLLPVPTELEQPGLASQSADCGETGLKVFATHTLSVELTCRIDTTPRQDLRFTYLSSDDGATWQAWKAAAAESFLDGSTGWRLLDPGGGQLKQLQQTRDAGLTWTTVSKVAWPSAELSFTGAQTGWALVIDGQNQALVRTLDGGKSWTMLKLQPQLDLMRLEMVDAQTGWAVAGDADYNFYVLHTLDGGQTWQDITPQVPGLGFDLKAVLNGQTAWGWLSDSAARPIQIRRTTDGGKTWMTLADPAGNAYDVTKFFSISEGLGMNWDVGAGQAHVALYATHNAGATWTQVKLVAPPEILATYDDGALHLCNICGDSFSFDAQRLFIAEGNEAQEPSTSFSVYLSLDRGQTWQKQDLSLPAGKFEKSWIGRSVPVIFSDGTGWLSSDLGTSDYADHALAFYATTDGGRHWTFRSLLETGTMPGAPQFVSSQAGFVVCGDELCVTHDGAQTWQHQKSDLHFAYADQGEYVSDFEFVSPTTGFAITELNSKFSAFWKTTDAGLTWTVVQAGGQP